MLKGNCCGNYYQYKKLTTPVALPLDLDFVKNYLKVDDTADDALITFLIKAAAAYVEKYTNRVLLETQFQTYRNNFGYSDLWFPYSNDYGCGIELKRSPFVSLDSYTYKNTDNIETVVGPTLYYITDKVDYSRILLIPGKAYPTDVLCVQQAIKILFTAGYGTSQDDIPVELQEAMLQIVADMYTNRGDCMTASGISCSCDKFLSAASKVLLDQFRILDL